MSAKRKKEKVKVPVSLLIASLGLIALVITALSTVGLDGYFNLCTGTPASVLGRFGGNAETVYLLMACFGVIFYGGLVADFRSRLAGMKLIRKVLPMRNASVVLSGFGFLLAVVRFALLAVYPHVKIGSGQDVGTAFSVFSIIVWVYFCVLLVAVFVNEVTGRK